MAKNEVQIKFTALTSGFNQGIKEMNSQITATRSALRLNAEQMKGSADKAELLKERQKLLATELQDSQEKTRLLSEKLKTATELFGEDSIEVQKLTTQLYNAQTAEEKIKQEIEQTNNALNKYEKEQNKTVTASQELTSKIEDQEGELKQLKEQYKDVVLEQGATSTEAKELAGEITSLNSELQKNRDKLDEAEKAADDLTGSIDEAGNSAQDASNGGFTVFKGILAELAADGIQKCVSGLKDFSMSVLNTGMDFEAGMSQVEAISGATSDDLEALKNKAKEMGETTKFTATDAAEAMKYMAMAGWEAGDMLGGIEGVLNLAAAAGEDLGTTADIVTDGLTAFGLKAKDASDFADVLAAASASANTNVSIMGETFKYAAPMAGSLGYSIEDVALAAGVMANSGIKSTMAGTALNAIFTRLSTNTNGAADALSGLGIEFFDQEGKARDLSTVMDELRSATANMTAEEKAQLANTIAGTEAQKGLLAILNSSEEDYNKVANAVNTATDATTGFSAAGEMAETMQDNLRGDLTLMQSAFDGFKQDIYEDIQEPLRDAAQKVTDEFIPAAYDMYEGIKSGGQWVKEHKGLIEGVALVLGSLTAGITAYNVVTGIKAGMEAAGTTSLLGYAGAQLGLNAAMLTCPITWIVAGIALLVGGFILLWNKCDGFRNFWTNAWNGIKTAATMVWDGLKKVGTGISNIFTGMKDFATNSLAKMSASAAKETAAMKSTFEKNGGGMKGVAAVCMMETQKAVLAGFTAINKLTGGKLGEWVMSASEKVEGFKQKFKDGIDKVKGFFNFKFQWPHIPMPSITVSFDSTGALAKAAQLLGFAGMPKFGIKWNAEGAILTNPTIFGFANGMFQGGGEAGHEAVLPISKLETYIGNQMQEFINMIPEVDYDRLGRSVAKYIEPLIQNTETKIVLNNRDIGRMLRELGR